MKICHLTSMHEWNDDRIFERACRSLQRQGHEVTLIAPASEARTECGVRILPLRQRSGWRRRLFSSREAYHLALAQDADIFHFHDPDLMPWMRMLAHKGRRVVYDIHEFYAARFGMWGLPQPVARPLRALFTAYEQAAIRRFSGIVTVTGTMATRFAKHYRDHAVVNNVPDLERLSGLDLKEGKDPGICVYTSGTHSSHRNCMQTIEAMPAVLEAFPGTVFRFVGSYQPDDFRRQLGERAQQLGVQANLILDGKLPWLENFRRTAKAQIGCVFYEDNENNRVTMPNRVFEYMVCGVAVIVHDFPELRNLVEQTGCGIVVDSADPQSIARGLTGMMGSAEQLQRMGDLGRQAIHSRYNFAQECREMVALYSRILDQPSIRDTSR